MIILLNQDSIRFETLSACRMRVAVSLGLELKWVELKLVPNKGGNLVPEVIFHVPDDLEDDQKRGKFFKESHFWIKEHVGQLIGIALREYRKRCEGAGCI
jgi:hypothetical protein